MTTEEAHWTQQGLRRDLLLTRHDNEDDVEGWKQDVHEHIHLNEDYRKRREAARLDGSFRSQREQGNPLTASTANLLIRFSSDATSSAGATRDPRCTL